MNTLLVTGGAGFIGSCFVRRAVERRSDRVVVLDKLTYAGNLDSLPSPDSSHFAFYQGDIADREFVAHLLREIQPAAILNFAAETHVDRSIDGPQAFVQTNVVGTCELLHATLSYWLQLKRAQRQAFRFLQVSTDEVYGSLGAEGTFSELCPYQPNSPYAASKAAADHFVRAYYETYKLPTIITHSSNNYGPYQFPEKLIPLMILNALEGKPLPLYGDGQNVRDWLYVDDHCRALMAVLDRGRLGSVYNVGANQERTNLQVVHAICDLVDQLRPGLPHAPCRNLVTFVPDRPGHDRRYALDTSKINAEVGWSPQEKFETGLRMTVQWYLDHSEWVSRMLSGAYRRERLGLTSLPSD